jgi:hypothetical protein
LTGISPLQGCFWNKACAGLWATSCLSLCLFQSNTRLQRPREKG